MGIVALNEAARLLGMSRRTLDRRIAAGALRVFRDGRIVGVPSDELARYVHEHTISTSSHGARARRGQRTSLPLGARLWD